MIWLGILIGVFIGAPIGFFTFALVSIAVGYDVERIADIDADDIDRR